MSQVKIEHPTSPSPKPKTRRLSSDSPEKDQKLPIKLIIKRPKAPLVSLNKRRIAEDGDKKKKNEDPDAPLQVNLTTKSQKRKALRTNIKEEESEDVQEARRREKERLERLESSKAATSNLINFITPAVIDDKLPKIKVEKIEEVTTFVPNEEVPVVNVKSEKADDDIILDRVVKKPSIELVELSSDDEDYKINGHSFRPPACLQSVSSNKVRN